MDHLIDHTKPYRLTVPRHGWLHKLVGTGLGRIKYMLGELMVYRPARLINADWIYSDLLLFHHIRERF